MGKATIQPENAYYIKLGREGAYEQHCIENGLLWLGYDKVPHDLCLAGDWEAVTADFVKRGVKSSTASNHARQVRLFYEAGPADLWITFYGATLWWGFAGQPVTRQPDGTKTRPMSRGWSNRSIATLEGREGQRLEKSKLSGRLLRVEGYRGTVCEVHAFDYLVRKINGERSPVERQVDSARKQLLSGLEEIIAHLHWRDFELLVDLIFRGAGWQRIGELGRAQRSIDLELYSPITNERIYVQVKGQAGDEQLAAFQKFCETLSETDRSYFIVHTPQGRLKERDVSPLHHVWLARELAELAFRYGLVDWVLSKAG